MTSSTTGPAAIDARGVVKSFGSVHAVRGVDLRVQPGEIVAFLGPNGAGKTTTIDMIIALGAVDAAAGGTVLRTIRDILNEEMRVG